MDIATYSQMDGLCSNQDVGNDCNTMLSNLAKIGNHVFKSLWPTVNQHGSGTVY